MDERERVIVEGACRQLIMRYAAAMDVQDWDLFLTVFADDFVWTRHAMAPMCNRAEVRAFFDNMWAKRRAENPQYLDVHLITTCSIEVESDGRAHGLSWCMMYSAPDRVDGGPAVMPPCPEMILLYRDIFERGGDGWRITRHDAQHQFLSPGYVAPPIVAGLAL